MNTSRDIPEDDWTEVLDRILDKGIVIDQRIQISFAGVTAILPKVEHVRIEKFSIQASGQSPKEIENLDDLFPYWRRDLWSK